jgi:hypothetical protein
MFPVIYKNNKYFKEDCDYTFLAFYECEESLNSEGMIYLSEHIWIAPNGETIED